ncbi:MAG: hypothetical protein H0V88_11340 [Pyrinomonadaceae bacterium]|nr:hypothetical protein [Pyrinomonadaceae bacterium]
MSLLVTPILFTSTFTWAQDKPTVCSAIEAAISSKVPEWKLSKPRIIKCQGFTFYKWSSNQTEVSTLIFSFHSARDATDSMADMSFDFEMLGMKVRRLEMRGGGLGDESSVWAGSHESIDDSFVDVVFRKGKLLVHVVAPTFELAKQFAGYAADAIPAA